MLAGLPVGVGHGELVEVGEQRRHHGVRRARNTAAAVAGVPVRRCHVFFPFPWRASRAPVMETGEEWRNREQVGEEER